MTDRSGSTGFATSRRGLLKSGAGVLAVAATTVPAAAQAPDAELARLQQARRILIKGGVVLTQDRQVGDFAQADVLIEDGKIRDIKPTIAADDAAVIDAGRRIVLPGFIDTHHHFYQGLLRNILTNGLLNPDYNRDIGMVLTPAYQPSDVYAGALVTALGMIDMGTTAAVDTSQVSHTPEHTDAGIKALQDAGIRAVYAYWRGQGNATQYPQDVARLQKTYFSSRDQLLTLALGATLDPKVFAFAREANLRTVSHGVSNVTERNLIQLGRMGLLKPGDEYIHCTQLSDESWRLIKDTGGRVSLAPPI